jgi:uncharacterized DUF497 family protein
MTEDQLKAFGFVEKNILWDEIAKILSAMQEQEVFNAISRSTTGEDRIHAAGRADGINMVASVLHSLREDACKKIGLTKNNFVQ